MRRLLRTRSRVNWCLLRVMVRHSRCSGLGETDDQLSGHMTPQQPLGVREAPLAAARRPVGKRLRQK
jgi:formylmethanofuran dehydrogenase subunit E